MTRLFRRLVTGSGLLPVTLHGAATLAAGTDLKIVQDQLGHSTITLTTCWPWLCEPPRVRRAE
jgi:integrase